MIIKVEGGEIVQTTGRYDAITSIGSEVGSFVTMSAARHWLAMDHEITESRAYRAGLRGEG